MARGLHLGRPTGFVHFREDGHVETLFVIACVVALCITVVVVMGGALAGEPQLHAGDSLD